VSVTIKPMGGLGNQLFQYAAGRKAAEGHGVPLYADLRHFSQNSLRNYQLDSFGSVIDPNPVGGLTDLVTKALSVIDSARSDRAHAVEPLFFGLVRERNHRFSERFINLPPRVTMRGYFQSWKYLVGQETALRSELADITDPSEWYKSESRVLADLGEFVAIHIRLGDYLLDPNFGHLTNTYFGSAVESVASDARPIVVFSDEPSRAAELPFLQKMATRQIVVVEPPPDSAPIESLNLLALAKDVIISNSTFGWWGAWLAQANHGGRVIAPTPWLLSTEFSEEDLIPSNWTRLDSTTGKTPPS